MVPGSVCRVIPPLRQCLGQNSIFIYNPENEVNFGWKHHFNNLNTKMTHFHILKMRLLWKLGKMVAKLDSRGKISWSQFWRFFNQISFISCEKQYLCNDQGIFWCFENFLVFLIFCKKNTKICIFFSLFGLSKKI